MSIGMTSQILSFGLLSTIKSLIPKVLYLEKKNHIIIKVLYGEFQWEDILSWFRLLVLDLD